MAKGSATPKRKTIFPDFLTLSGGNRKAFLLLERRIKKTVFIFAGDFLFSGCQPEACRPERQRGRSSVLHRRKGDEEGRHPLLSGDFRLPAGGLFFFRRKMSGSLPEGHSSFVGRCPAASRRVILLSSEDVRLLAGGLFFFRRRKKNQERRHPFERVDDDLGALPPRPPPPINGRPSHQHLLPALPCRPGETFLAAAVKLYLFFAGRWPDQVSFPAAARRIPPARRVGRAEAGGVP